MSREYRHWNDDERDSWHLLQLAESGRGTEAVAQFMASMFISGGELSPYAELTEWNQVIERTRYLVANDGEIWPHLTPGGGQGIELEHPDTRRMDAVFERLQQIDDTTAIEDIITFLEADGYIDRGWGELRRREREAAEEKFTNPVVVMVLTNQIDNPGWLVAQVHDDEMLGVDPHFTLHIWDHDPNKDSVYEMISSNYDDPNIVGRKDLIRVEAADLSDAQGMANLQDILMRA